MTKISREDIQKLASLARLELSENELEKFQEEISEILSYVEILDSVDSTNIKPTYQVTGLVNVMREDTEYDYGTSQSDLLKNAPEKDKDFIKVKRMIG